MRIRWSRRAADQLLAAVRHLEGERVGSGREFHEAVRSTVDLIAVHPRVYPVVPSEHGGEVRRALLRRWSYWLIFEVREVESQVLVLSIWHVRRRPEEAPR